MNLGYNLGYGGARIRLSVDLVHSTLPASRLRPLIRSGAVNSPSVVGAPSGRGTALC